MLISIPMPESRRDFEGRVLPCRITAADQQDSALLFILGKCAKWFEWLWARFPCSSANLEQNGNVMFLADCFFKHFMAVRKAEVTNS